MESTTAQDIMSTELITIQEGETVEQAVKILINKKITGLPVVDSSLKMIGVLSEFDLIRQISEHKDLTSDIFREPIQFSKKAFSLPSTATLAEVVKHFLDSKFRRIPIVDVQGRLVGIITRRDLMRVYYYRAKLT